MNGFYCFRANFASSHLRFHRDLYVFNLFPFFIVLNSYIYKSFFFFYWFIYFFFLSNVIRIKEFLYIFIRIYILRNIC